MFNLRADITAQATCSPSRGMIRLDRGSVLSFAAGDKVLMKLFIIINRMKLTPSLFADQQGRVSRRDQQVVYDKAVVGRASRQGAQRPRLDR